LLQRNEEDQRYGWTLHKRKVKWNLLQKKLRQRIKRREELTRDELQQGRIVEDEVNCEPEQGSILGEDSDDDEDMMLTNDCMNHLKGEDQLRDLMYETSKEVARPYDFKTNDWCVFAGFSSMEDDRQSFKTITLIEKKMTTYSHIEGSEESQGEMRGDAIKRTSQEELDRVIDEVLEEISKVEKIDASKK
jgi:pyruvate formate-lyase activating enzyme-like uncharacterized protein